MTEATGDTVLTVVVRLAMEATGATRGCLVATDEAADLRVVASYRAKPDGARAGAGAVGGGGDPPVEVSDLVGYVVATGQPQVVASRGPVGPGALGAAPTSALCAPCIHDDDVVGALEVADKADGGRFSIDDLELVSLFAALAAAALVAPRIHQPPPPAQLIGELQRLAVGDPARYATVARLVQRLLDA